MSSLPKIVGKNKAYKIEKRPGKNGIVYFLRCLWHLCEDPQSDEVISWDPDHINRFVIPNEKLLNEFLKTYDGFKTSLASFRRSLYFYGFRKSKNVWMHNQIDKNNKDSLKLIRRKANTKKDRALKLRTQYMQLMLSQMKQMHPHFNFGNPGASGFMKAQLPPSYSTLSSSNSGNNSHTPEEYSFVNPYLPSYLSQDYSSGQSELPPMLNTMHMSNEFPSLAMNSMTSPTDTYFNGHNMGQEAKSSNLSTTANSSINTSAPIESNSSDEAGTN